MSRLIPGAKTLSLVQFTDHSSELLALEDHYDELDGKVSDDSNDLSELSVAVANNVTNLVNQEKQLADNVNNVEDDLNGKSIKE